MSILKSIIKEANELIKVSTYSHNPDKSVRITRRMDGDIVVTFHGIPNEMTLKGNEGADRGYEFLWGLKAKIKKAKSENLISEKEFDEFDEQLMNIRLGETGGSKVFEKCEQEFSNILEKVVDLYKSKLLLLSKEYEKERDQNIKELQGKINKLIGDTNE